MTRITTKTDYIDVISAADMNAVINKIQTGGDRDLSFASSIYVTGLTSTRMQSAFDSLPSTGGKLVLPPGNYAMATALYVTSSDRSVVIEGYGMSTILSYSGNMRAISIFGNQADIGGVTLRDFRITNNGGTGSGIQIANMTRGLLSGVHVDGFSTVNMAGITFATTYEVTAIDCYCYNNYYGVKFRSSNADVIVGGAYRTNTHGFVFQSGSSGNKLYGPTIESNASFGILFGSSSNVIGNRIDGCWFENNYHGIYFRPSGGLVLSTIITGNNFNSQGSTAMTLSSCILTYIFANEFPSNTVSIANSGASRTAWWLNRAGLLTDNGSNTSILELTGSGGLSHLGQMTIRPSTTSSFLFWLPGQPAANVELRIPTKKSTGIPTTAEFGSIPGALVWNNVDKKLFIRGTNTWSSAVFA